MAELITAPAKLFISIIMFLASVFIAQMSKLDPIISQGFDQLISLGILLVGIVTLWRALSQKEKEINSFKKETIDKLIEIIERNEKKDS